MGTNTAAAKRLEKALRAALPLGASLRVRPLSGGMVVASVDDRELRALWIGQGWLSDAQAALAHSKQKPDVLVAQRMSPAARSLAANARVSWVDESGAAQIKLPGLLISHTGRPAAKTDPTPRWTASVIGTAETLLLGTTPTVAEVHRTTGLSTGSATTALAKLTALGLLRSNAARGRDSARVIVDRTELLNSYAEAATARKPRLSLRVGISGRDLIDELKQLGTAWDRHGTAWAATGAAGAAVLGPYLADVTTLDVFIDAATAADLDYLTRQSGLKAMEGGRLLLRPFPTAATRRLSGNSAGVRIAPWPRVYADLRVAGVRGEEAAEHLREAMQHG